MFKPSPVALAIAALCCAATSAQAEEQSNQTDTKVDETVKVWGTQIDNGSMLSQDISMKQADHLSDLLRDQAGVDVGGSHSMNQGINIRGVSELDLEITIDGVSQANNVFHHVGNLLINPDILKAVDLQVGNNSVLNGGIGGGVAFETKDAADLLKDGEQFGARVMGGFASNDYYNYSTTGYGQLTDTVDVMMYYSAIDRENFEDGDGVERVGQEGKTENYMIKFGWNLNESNRFELSYDNFEDAGDYTQKSNMGGGDYDHTDHIYPIEYTRESITLTHELMLGSTEVRTSVYSNEMTYTADKTNAYFDGKTRCYPDDDFFGDCVAGDETEGSTKNVGFKSLAETEFDFGEMWHTARYGLEANFQESEKKTNGDQVGDKEQADSFAVYAEDEIEVAEGWFVTPGVRYNYYKVDMAASDTSYNDTTFGLSTKYQVTDQWTVRAAATELFKGPALTGSFLTSGSELNPNLKPETGINYEVGAAFEDNNIVGLDSLGFSVTLFQTEVDDYIDDTSTGKASMYSNLGDYELTGFESTLNMRRGDLAARLTYSKSDSEFTHVESNSGLIKGQSLEDEVGDSISFNLDYELTSVGVNLSWTSLFTLDEDVNDVDNTEKEAYDVHSINASWTPTTMEDLTITAGIENMFDEHYASHASHDFGYTDYEPGRNYKVTFAYQF